MIIQTGVLFYILIRFTQTALSGIHGIQYINYCSILTNLCSEYLHKKCTITVLRWQKCTYIWSMTISVILNYSFYFIVIFFICCKLNEIQWGVRDMWQYVHNFKGINAVRSWQVLVQRKNIKRLFKTNFYALCILPFFDEWSTLVDHPPVYIFVPQCLHL